MPYNHDRTMKTCTCPEHRGQMIPVEEFHWVASRGCYSSRCKRFLNQTERQRIRALARRQIDDAWVEERLDQIRKAEAKERPRAEWRQTPKGIFTVDA